MKFFMSDPEYPSVFSTIFRKSSSVKAWRMALRPCSTIQRRASGQGSGMYSCFGMRRRAASSSSSGRFVAPTISTRRSLLEGSQPSICTRSSVFRRRLASCSPSALRALSSESISSMKTTAGCTHRATVKSALTSFSPSPIHLDVREEALTLKNVASILDAIALPSSVFPVPGGPKSKRPLGGVRAPEKTTGLRKGHTTIS
mmetsp:Transcript_35284/g.99464  ORF Transcript_35284/g.99464 Transcript_35284/m.99464 type:complete len:201 (-) Transcript_35284:180-782(-)